MKRDPRVYLDDILEALRKIETYTNGLDVDSFSRDSKTVDAVVRNFEIIGEATKKVSDDYKQVHFEVPWKAMSGMRDKLIHDYIGVDTAVIWKTIKEDLSPLKKKLEDK